MADPTDHLQIRDYLQIVLRRRWIIIGIVLAGLVAAALHNWRATPIFEGRARLQIEADPDVLGLARPLDQQRSSAREFYPTQVGILESRTLAQRAHEELKLSEEGGTDAPTVGQIVRGRRVSQVKDTRLVDVAFRSTDPALAARVADALARAYVQQSLEVRTRTGGEASEWLTQQVEEQRKLVQTSEAALQRYREQHGAEALFADRTSTERQNIVVQKLAELSAAATRARAETIEKETLYKQLSAIQANQEALDTLPAIASNGFIQQLKADLARLQQQRAQASERLGERHPEMLKLDGAIQNAEDKLQTEVSKVAHAIRNDFEAAQARERALSGALQRQKGEVQGLNAKTIEYIALEREAATNRQMLDSLLERSREAMLARDVQTTNARILDVAEIPRSPILPNERRNLMMGFVGSSALALGLIFLLEVFNTRITSADDVRRHLRIPVLGLAPQVKKKKGQGSLLLTSGTPPRFGELLRGVRTNLVFAPELAITRTVQVTSAEPGEGKTMVAANLAVSLARLNQRVLLIDADLRRSQLHEMFGVDQQPGLTEVLTGKATPDRALRDTRTAHLWVMPGGVPSPNPADLLGSDRFRQLIDWLGKQFDWLVIDSPPVLAVTDSCLIAQAASGVLFVVGCGQTSRNVARAAVEQLEGVEAPLVGAVLNRAVLDQDRHAYLPYYHRDYQTYYHLAETGPWLPDAPAMVPNTGSTDTAAPTRVQG